MSLLDWWNGIADWWTYSGVADALRFMLLIFAVVLILLVGVAWGISPLVEGNRQHQVDTCVAAFEYTRLQCEFIVDNKVMP